MLKWLGTVLAMSTLLVALLVGPVGCTIDPFAANQAVQTVPSSASDAAVVAPTVVGAPVFPPTTLPFSSPTREVPLPSATPTPSEADVVALLTDSVVQIVTDDGAGSGVKIPEGVITNAHVVGDAQTVRVYTRNGHELTALVTRYDPRRDLALLLLDSPDVVPAELEPVSKQRQGDTILVLGYPRPDAVGGEATLTRGLISAIRREPTDDVLLVQTDAALNPGNSGGPMINRRGKVVAIAASRVKDSEGLGFGIATETVQAFLLDPSAYVSARQPKTAAPDDLEKLRDSCHGLSPDAVGPDAAHCYRVWSDARDGALEWSRQHYLGVSKTDGADWMYLALAEPGSPVAMVVKDSGSVWWVTYDRSCSQAVASLRGKPVAVANMGWISTYLVFRLPTAEEYCPIENFEPMFE